MRKRRSTRPFVPPKDVGCSTLRAATPILAVVCALAGAAVVGTTACGSSSSEDAGQSISDVQTAIDGLTGQARTAKLAELAAAEGGLTLYTSSSVDYMTDLADAFEDAYDVEVSTFKTSGEALVSRMVEENAADYRGSDVAESNVPGLITLADEGIITPYDSPSAERLVAGSVGRSWIADKSNTFVVAWNTDRVAKGDEPRSLEDLGDPKWAGRLALEASDSDWYKTVWEDLVKRGATPGEADRVFEAIARNATFVKGHTLMTQLVAAGEFDVTVSSYLHTVRGLMEKGAPLAWQPALEPLVSRPDGIALAAEARHPASAMLFIDFALAAGQKIFTDYFLTATRKDLTVPSSIAQVAMDVPDYVAHVDEWTERYERLVGLGKEAPDTD